MKTIQSVLITGANSGLDFEAARQLALQNGVGRIVLACRSIEKARVAKTKLITLTKREIFEIAIMDVSNSQSVRNAVANLETPVDALVLNAGGMGGRTPNDLTKDGVTNIFAANLLGHVVLVKEMLERQLVTSTILYAGSEAARGIPKMGVAKPELSNRSAEEFASIANGKKFGAKADPLNIYGTIKLMGALWMASMSRQYPHLRFVTMSPGGTTGTKGMDDLPFLKKVFFKYVGGLLMPLFGMMHSVETGAKRYVDGLLNIKFETGRFYASKEGVPTGQVVDQETIDSTISNEKVQDNALLAIEQFI